MKETVNAWFIISKMSRRIQVLKYVISDYLSAGTAWSLFYVFRKLYIEPQKYGYKVPVELDQKFYLGLIFIPLFWLAFYTATGYYKTAFRKSRLTELGQTLQVTIIGVVILFFTLILDDTVGSYKNYYFSLFTLMGMHFILTYIPRLIITTNTAHKIHNGKLGFNTIIIGGNEKAVDVYNEIQSQERSTGNKIVGYVHVKNGKNNLLDEHLTNLGELDNLAKIIPEMNVEEVIIAIESYEHNKIGKIINLLGGYKIIIKAIPSMYDILTGKVRMSTIFGTPLIEITHRLMPYWQEQVKRFIDIFVSILAMIILLPLSLFLIIGIKITSKGPAFYSHERMGKYGLPFKIYKFRSMYIDAEKNGPQLSSRNDDRITSIGRFMRKSRLDEIPNFFNVLIGDMSLVGPRPERPYFIDQIMKVAPHYIHLQKVRPGITSWGQVKFGYASTVEQMVRRLKYDLLYIENMSLYVDLKILIYTALTIVRGRGV